jgi:uncharacterized protein YqeY
MMTLRERLVEEMKVAMKAKDDLKLSVIRMVRSSVKNREIDLKRELDDQGVTEIIVGIVKQRKDSIRLFKEAGREDLVAKEEKELALLLEFLPKQLDRGEIEALVAKAIVECGAQGASDLGKVMKVLKPLVAGVADGKLVNDIVREKLA